MDKGAHRCFYFLLPNINILIIPYIFIFTLFQRVHSSTQAFWVLNQPRPFSLYYAAYSCFILKSREVEQFDKHIAMSLTSFGFIAIRAEIQAGVFVNFSGFFFFFLLQNGCPCLHINSTTIKKPVNICLTIYFVRIFSL